jgi:hypothetical protein
MTRTVLVIGIAAAAVSVAFAGSSWASSTGSSKRLSRAQWTTYQKANKSFTSVNAKGIATFRHCTQITRGVSPSAAPDAFKKCLDGTVAKVTKATTAFAKKLQRFQARVSGSCTAALNNYIGSLYGWANVANGIQHAVSLGQLPNTANAQTAYNQITSAAKAFTTSCRPAG